MVNAATTLLPTVKCSTLLYSLLFSTYLPLLFFSTHMFPIPIFICVHFFMLPSPLLLSAIFQSHFLHSCFYELQNFEKTHNFLQQMKTSFNSYFLSLNFLPLAFIFWPPCRLLINASSLELWWPITTTFYVPYTTMWKHVTSSLWMNTSNFIFWLFYIHNPPKLIVLTPHHSPCTPFVDCVNTFVNYANTFVDCAHTFDDYANTSANLINALDTPTSNFYIPNSFFL